MRSLYLSLALAFLIPNISLAQKDVAAGDFMDINTQGSYDGKTEVLQQVFWAGLAFENVGDDLSANDNFDLKLFVDGEEAFYGHGEINIAGPMPNGTVSADFDYYYFKQYGAGEHEVCVVVDMEGDSNSANDTACITMTLVHPDFEVLSFRLLDPIVSEGGDIEVGDEFKRVRIVTEYHGATFYYGEEYENFDLGMQFDMDIQGGGRDTCFYTTYLGTAGTQPFEPGEVRTLDIRESDDYPFPEFPSWNGEFEICVSPVIENNAGDYDAICSNYNITGATNIEEEKVKVGFTLNEESISISLPSNSFSPEYNIYNLQGKLISSGKLEGIQDQISLNSLSSGIYILRIANQSFRFKH